MAEGFPLTLHRQPTSHARQAESNSGRQTPTENHFVQQQTSLQRGRVVQAYPPRLQVVTRDRPTGQRVANPIPYGAC
jgi:hypothetical protein